MLSWRDIKNPEHGGAEVVTHEHMKRWVKKGHKCTLFTSAFSDCKREEIIEGYNVIRAGNKYSVYYQAWRYYKKHFEGKFDLVIDQINTIPFFTPFYVKEKKIVLIHQLAKEFWFYETKFPINLLGYLIEPLYLKFYKNLLTMTVSNSTKQDLLSLGFSNIKIIPEGIDFKPLAKVPKKEKEPALIFVGRLKKVKRPHHAIKAFKLVKKEIPNVKLWIVGDGYFKKKLKKLTYKGIKFFGHISKKEKLELMKKAHAIIVPGLREGWGLIVTEANAMGTPAVGYNIHGLRDSIKDYKTGLLTKKNNPEELSKKILELLNNNVLKEELSKNALSWSKKFSWDNSAKESLRILERLK